MARMLPEKIPLEIERDPRHGAERRVYQALARDLPPDYTVFGWSTWLGRTDDSSVREGELDFVVAHPENGILVIEVKGGGVSYDATTRVWLNRDKAGRLHEMKDSYAQAAANRRALVRKFDELPSSLQRHPFIGHAVWFTDITRREEPLRPDAPPAITGYREDVLDPLPFVRAAMDYWRAGKPSFRGGRAAIEALEGILAGSFSLRVSLAGRLQPAAERQVELTEQQYWIINGLAGNPRLLVTGGAGTGKTFLAIERARRLADQGFRTLLCCFNQPLAEFLRRNTAGVSDLTVVHYHDLCRRLVREAGLALEEPPFEAEDAVHEAYYSGRLPKLVAEALRITGPRFDAIIVDEGQDFSHRDRDLLRGTLLRPDRDVLWVFQDAAQRIYEDKALWGETGMMTLRLDINLRNTRDIHAVLTRLSGDTETSPGGPDGVRPKLIAAPTIEAQRRELGATLRRLLEQDEFHPEQIAVLTSSRRQIPLYAADGTIAGIPITEEHWDIPGAVLFESIPRFKGLERDVVILVGIQELSYLDLDSELYVGASRARTYLVIIDTDSVLERFAAKR